MTSSLAEAIRSSAGELRRLAAVLCIAAGLTLALGMVFPVQYELDTAGYRETSARTIAPLTAGPEEATDLRAELDGDATVGFIDFFTDARKGDRVVGNVSLWALRGDTIDAEVTLMPESTRVAGDRRDPADHGDWIDISADIASQLGVGVGDTVEVGVGSDERAALTVRGIYAARLTGSSGLAHISTRALTRHDAGIDLTTNTMVSAASPERVERFLNTPPWDARMSRIYQLPVEVDAMTDELARAERHAFASFPVVLVISMIAVAALLAIVVGETVALIRGFRPTAEVLLELGARPDGVYRGLLLGVGSVIVVSLGVGSAVGTIAYSTGFAGPALPPTIATIWLAVTGITAATGLGAAALAARLQRRKALL